MPSESHTSRVLIRNPQSGDGETTHRARDVARTRGWEVWDTDGGNHTRDLAAEAVEENYSLVAAGGGDGTLNKVVRGVLEATKERGDGDGRRIPDTPTLGVVPVGTGNDFADNVGIRGVGHAFDVLESGETRRLDVGFAGKRPFLNSCVGGLTANASARTSRPLKRRLGVVAYVLSTLQELREFEAPRLEIHAEGVSGREVWSGNALMLLVGNGRRFPGERMKQANMEDGLLNVVVIEDAPAIDYLTKGAATRLLRKQSEYLTRIKVPSMEVSVADRDVQFSLDGEIIDRDSLSLSCSNAAMRFKVASGYDPDPVEWGQVLNGPKGPNESAGDSGSPSS